MRDDANDASSSASFTRSMRAVFSRDLATVFDFSIDQAEGIDSRPPDDAVVSEEGALEILSEEGVNRNVLHSTNE